MSDLAGRIMGGRYAIESLIGNGGMADVYRGTDTTLQRPIAIKILTDRSDTVLRRFLREARSMAALNHRNIVAVYDAGQTDGLSYIIMEYIEGRTLAAIPTGELTMHVTIRYFIDVLEALAYAHEHGTIHRDVKPANVMVTHDNVVKIMDFGMSRRMTEMSSETHAGEIVGTIAYLAPERFLGKIADARSDLYSVGIMMYEIFAGSVPFSSENDDLVAVIFKHVNERPAALRSINAAIPPPIDRIVLQLLEKDPDDRYASAREVSAELQALIGGGPAAADNPASPAPNAAPAIPSAPSGGPARRPSPDDVRQPSFDRPAGRTGTLNAANTNALAGMLAARKRDYPEAIRSYTLAMRAFLEVGNDVEHAKTAIKYGAMIALKNKETDRPDKREIDETIKLLEPAILSVRSRRMMRENDEGEQALHALRRLGLRLH